MMNIVLLVLLLFQVSFAMDSSVMEVLKCAEIKKMDVFAVEKIDGRVYATGWFVRSGHDPCRNKTDYGSSVFEYKKNCVFQEKNWFKNIYEVRRMGLLGAMLNSNQDSIIVSEMNSVLWSCPLKTENLSDFYILDKNRLMIGFEEGELGDGDSIGLLNSNCQWTLVEKKGKLPSIYSATSDSRYIHYYLKQDEPYIVFLDSLYGHHWGTLSSFYIYVSTRKIACGYADDCADQSKSLIKCIEWTGFNFVEKVLPHKVNVPEHYSPFACPWTERLFPCGGGICSQNFESKKIEILVDE